MASILAKLNAVTTFINAIASIILASILYNALRPILEKSNLLLPISK